MTGFHWGTGSAMTSVEIMSPVLGDAFVDVSRKHGVGFNAVSLTALRIDGSTISFDLKGVPELHTALVKFAGIDPQSSYRIVCNRSEPITVSGKDLEREGHAFPVESIR